MDLIKYDTARMWLAQAASVDEVKEIRNKSVAMEEYARLAKDAEMIENATKIRKRAERRLGEMMAKQPKAVGSDYGGKGNKIDRVSKTPSIEPPPITLEQAGIDKNLAKRARKVAAMSEGEFEEHVEASGKAAAASLERQPRKQTVRADKISSATKLAIAIAYLDEKLTRDEISSKFGVSNGTVQKAVAAEKVRRENPVDQNSLPPTTKQKLEALIKQTKTRLEADFERRLQEALRDALNDTVLPHYNQKMDEFDEVVKARRGIMDRTTYKLILSCLHPDQSSSAERIRKAFDSFRTLELVLCDETELPTSSAGLPKTYDEMIKRREEVRASRRRKSNGKDLRV